MSCVFFSPDIFVICLLYGRVGFPALWYCCCFFQAEDGIRDLVRSRGLGDVYKRQMLDPGIGFGKTQAHNLTLLRGLSLFHGLGCPILLLSLIHI